MTIKIILAFSNRIFSEGIARLLEDDDSIKVATVLEPGIECPLDKISPVNVILTDFATLYSSFPNLDASKKYGFILFDTDCGRENLASAIVSKNISGVIMGQASPAVLKKAVRAVARGEVWIDQATVKDLLYGINSIKKDKSDLLSAKEKEIVELIGKGLRNREVADALNISELTVKTHLHRIFRKLDIKTRSQLITYSIKNVNANDRLYEKRKSTL